jgi:hypothetical protein
MPRSTYTAAFKTKIVLEVLREECAKTGLPLKRAFEPIPYSKMVRKS